MNNLLSKILIIFINIAIRIYKRVNKQNYKARLWSNREIKKIAPLFKGNIINVSAGNDGDKENNFYQNYFINKASYIISNYKRTQTNDKEIILDLEQNVPENLIGKFDVVFTHTVLEHIFNIDKAIENLCKLSKDIVITVVPFLQTYHHEEEYYFDYWRFSPLALIKKFDNYHFKTVYINWNNDPLGNIYVIHVTSSNPNKWTDLIELNKQNLKQFAPGFYRHRLHTKLNSNTDRTVIKSFENFLESH